MSSTRGQRDKHGRGNCRVDRSWAGAHGGRSGWNLLRACESRKQVRDGGDTPSCNVGSTVVCRESHACRSARRVHARQSGAHFAGLLGPRHPRRPRPWHRPCGTFFRQQTCHPRRPVPPKFLGPRAPRPFCAFPQDLGPRLSPRTEKKVPRRQRRRREACALELPVASEHGRSRG